MQALHTRAVAAAACAARYPSLCGGHGNACVAQLLSRWDCWRDGSRVGNVTIWHGHRAADAVSRCNAEHVATCSNGCRALRQDSLWKSECHIEMGSRVGRDCLATRP